MANIKRNYEELIGNTPLYELGRYVANRELQATILAELEYFNPAGSVKDRAAWAMIDEAEKAGRIKENSVLVELTSGNTGIGLAAVTAAKGYQLKIVMLAGVSEERKKLIRAYGAQVDAKETLQDLGSLVADTIRQAEEIPNSFIPDQFGNPANPGIHFKTTGPEIYKDTDGKVDIFVAGVGTGGTISGVGNYLKSQNPDVRIVAVQPSIEYIPSPDNPAPDEIMGVHRFQGNVDMVPPNIDFKVIDDVIDVATPDACTAARSIAREEGLLIGISSGAAVWAATELAKRPENKGKVIVALLPDTGERYLSTNLFAYE